MSYLNWLTILGYVVMILATLANMFALQQVPLKAFVYILPITFILIPILSYLVLKEHLNKQYLIGSGFIVLGIIIFNF